VRVEDERIGLGHAGQQPASFRQDGGAAGQGRVHVEPQGVAAGDRGDGGHGVDGRRGGGPHGGHDGAGGEARGAVGGDEPLQRRRVHGVVGVHRHLDQVGSAEAGDHHVLLHRRVGFRGGVDPQALGPGAESVAVDGAARQPLAGGDEGGQRGGGGGVLDGAAERRRQAQHLAEPVHDHLLQLGGRRRGLPIHGVDTQARREQLAQDGRPGVVAREVGEEAGVVPVGDARHHDVAEIGEDPVPVLGPLGRGGGELRPDVARLDAGPHGVAVGVVHVVGHPVHELVAVAAERGTVHGVFPRRRCSRRRRRSAARRTAPSVSRERSRGGKWEWVDR